MQSLHTMTLLSLMLSASCNLFQSNEVSLINRSNVILTDLRFSYANSVFERSALHPSERLTLAPDATNDGAILVTYKIDEKIIEHHLGYAVAIPMTCEYKIETHQMSGGCEER